MLRIRLQERILLIGAAADGFWKGQIFVPTLRGSAVLHVRLEGLRAAVFLVVQSALDGIVQMPCREIGGDARVEGLRVVAVQPEIELFHFFLRESGYRAFDFLERV
jgi:hypothetical protein